jgi:thiol-disulfide isomerase/thioredoxin
MQKKDGSKINLHDVESPFTVVYIWDPDCGHCKKAAPKVVEFYEKFKDKGVTIFSICGKFTDEVKTCWDTIEEKGFDNFMNVVDPYHRSKYKVLYNIKSTPQIFILDENKEIIMKRIGAEQLSEVMDQIILQEQKEMQGK